MTRDRVPPSMAPNSNPPPSGVYVPAVLFFDENEEFDVPAIQAHILRLAKASAMLLVPMHFS